MELEFRGGNTIVVSFKGRAGWNGRYKIDSRDMTPAAAAAKIEAVCAHHDKKAACLDRFRPLFGVEFVLNTELYRIVGCTVWELGYVGNAVQLHLEIRRIDQKGNQFKVDRFPLTMTYATIDAVPSNPEILALIIGRLNVGEQAKATHASFETSVKQILGMGAEGVTP